MTTSTATSERRRERAAELAPRSDGDRRPLVEHRARLLDRLQRRSDDVDATEELRTVELALSKVPRAEGIWAWQDREQRRSRRRRRRRRRHG